MLLDTLRLQQSLRRAREMGLEQTIERMRKDEGVRKGSQKAVDQRRATLIRQLDDPLVAQVRLERIMQGNELTDINYLAQGTLCARSVCRVAIRLNNRLEGYGTGFMVAPGILMTNEHVLSSPEYVKQSLAEFRYERDVAGADLEPVAFAFRTIPAPIIFKDLDFCLAAVEPRSVKGEALDQFGWLKLNVLPNKALIGEYLTIIQHPNGERKQICVRENKLIKYSEDGPYLWYQTDTVGGSSGSPVFNNSWEVVGLHHSGVPKTRRIGNKDVWMARNGKPWDASMGEEEVEWIANEGIRISRIASYLATERANDAVAQAVRAAGEPRQGETTVGGPQASGFGDGVQVETRNGRTRILVPIDIDVNVGQVAAPRIAADVAKPADAARPFDGALSPAIEKVSIDQTNYGKRNGYDPAFLGTTKALAVALPAIKTPRGKILKVKGKPAIDYWNYTVVMNEDRSLAYFSAANVDAGKFRGTRDAEGDTWYDDPRAAGHQIGKSFYKKQSTFEADRTNSPFDQGHLTRRGDLQWGGSDDDAKRNGDDSYHYTNCAPQHWQFNQNNKASGLWFRLETLAIEATGGKSKLCIVNGPIFDAPVSTRGADGKWRLNPAGKSVADGTFGKVAIPKQFFKLFAWVADKKLQARAFVVSQEDLLGTTKRFRPTEAASVLTDQEIRLYQVRIPQLEKLTGLDFHGLEQFEVAPAQESLRVANGLPIEDERDLVF